jgi:fibronectin-binding autotransporter adhesin
VTGDVTIGGADIEHGRRVGERQLAADAHLAAGGQAAAAAGVLDAAALSFEGRATLVFNHTETDYGFATALSGFGTIEHRAGVTRLTGDSSAFTGLTSIYGGTLLVNGTIGNDVFVGGGGTLGGTGTIGGDVFVASTATLAPGSQGVGTLTVGGDLGFGTNAVLAYEFGQANAPGGPLNDLVNVGGDLTLDGTINVTQPTGGSFGPGVYRVINYTGLLTDNGLTVGGLPSGAAFVQTAVANQVNLVNTAGLALNFWDGPAGPRNDGVIQGGAGAWVLGGGANDWTEVNGLVNADYAQDSFAIFQGAGGIVTIDNSGGNVLAAGMQFTADGYTIAGGPLTLTGTQAFVRVGDGSAGDAGITTTIDAALTGSAQLVKDMGGSLVLTGANSYTGGTAINGGTLQIGNGGTTGSITGDVVNNAALVTNRSDVLVLDGAVSGSGSLTQAGGGLLTLTADNSYTGGTTIAAGTLQLGNGGATGSIVGDVLNDGNLAFARSDTLTFAGTISGSGSVTQQSGGTTILTGPNGYAGETRIAMGALLINGDQSAATGVTNVLGDATLGGIGTIGGDVVVADGATLAPGAGGAGALTINGSLSLAPAAVLNVDFGAANAVGSPLNDVVNIGGDLTLDGTLNVAVTPGGAFDIGLYRIASYGGTLTDNGLALGALPAGADAFVQTSVANQVNLINVGGATLNFWDGAAGPRFNGAINGGSGVWQNGTGNDNWADATGAVNAGYADGAFAIFTGAAGTVTIDNSLGAVTASDLQFASDGYTIGGDALTFTGPQSVIRVGDGTAAGADYTAAIGAELTGATQLVKTDAGTLVLTGANSYTGGTLIDAGTLRIASDANLGEAAGGLGINNGTLNTTADLSSGRAVDLAGAGSFLTDASTTLTLTGAVSGVGSLTKSGGGMLVLSGTGSYAGATNVSAGTLLVNGDFGAATGATTVASGASLGGAGTIGGDVTLANGATLTPGADGAGTLTIGGDLSLASGSQLAFEFGQANALGGALNDLVNVGGDLTLDGTINVTVPTGGAFGAGIYRVFNYGGTLIDNGLTIGALPGGSSAAVQTSITGQVNLVNADGLALSFWDGAVGPKNNGVINGGAGVWQNNSGNDNWTDANGAVNAAYSDEAFAVFGGAGGAVTVDNSLGEVTAAGMQFAANGYTIAGDAVVLTGPQSTIRVGDGSTAGAGFTATINSVLAGDTQLVKTDAGVLILGGANTYTGGTLVNGGTVQISADANLGAASGDVTLDGGTLATSANLTSNRGINLAGAGTISTASGTTFTFDGLLSGSGMLTTAGAGTLLLTGDNSGFAGSTQVDGTLTVNGSLCGDVNVGVGGRLQGTGTVCSTVNAGTIATGNSIGTLTVAGDYTGNAGTLEVEAELGDDASPTDRLVVTGGTLGTTEVVVLNQGGLGAATVEGIKIVDVGGASDGVFTLNGDYVFEGEQAVIAGAYGYRLYKNGVATPSDGDWYLRSSLLEAPGQPNEPQAPLYQPGVPLYESYAETLQSLSRLPTLQERVGNRQWAGFSQSGIGMWSRVEGTRYRPEATASTSGADLDLNDWSLQAGFDAALRDDTAGTLIAGINGRYGEADAQVRSRFGNGEIDASGFGLGATLTWYGGSGFYADAQAQLSWYRSELQSGVLGTLVDDNHGTGEAFSLEVGKRAPLGGGLSVTPQIQMAYSNVRFDQFVDPSDALVSSDEGESLRTRWGVSLDHQKAWDGRGGERRTHVYGLVNLSYEWLDGSVADVSGTSILRPDDRLWGELGVGGSYSWNDGRITLFSEVAAETALSNFGDSTGVRANAGLRMKF